MDLLSSQLCCSRISCIWRDDILFIHSSVSGCLGCFHFGAVMENASVDSHVQVFVWTHDFSSLGCTLGVELLGRVVTLFNIVLLLFSRSVVSDSLQPHELQKARLPCPSPSPRACLISGALGQWCHPTFSSCCQSFPTSRPFPMSGLFVSGDQRTGASTSALVFPMNIQGWFPLGLTSLISLLSKGLSPTPRFKSINSLAFSLLYGPTFTSVHDYWKNHSFDYMDLCKQSNVSAC